MCKLGRCGGVKRLNSEVSFSFFLVGPPRAAGNCLSLAKKPKPKAEGSGGRRAPEDLYGHRFRQSSGRYHFIPGKCPKEAENSFFNNQMSSVSSLAFFPSLTWELLEGARGHSRVHDRRRVHRRGRAQDLRRSAAVPGRTFSFVTE